MHSADRPLDPEDFQTLRRLEEILWRAETRFDGALMDGVFAPDFFEFGRSGRSYARNEMLLDPATARPIGATLPLPDFHARHLSDDVVQVTYVSEVVRDGEALRANRSSIWSRTADGWQLRFHQGKPV
jgi:hypothetical protein